MDTTPNYQLPPVQLSFYLAPGTDPAGFRQGLEKKAAEKNIEDLVLDVAGIRNIESLGQTILPCSTSPESFLHLELGEELTYRVRISHELNKDPTITQGWLAKQPISVPDFLRQLGVDEIMLDGNYLID